MFEFLAFRTASLRAYVAAVFPSSKFSRTHAFASVFASDFQTHKIGTPRFSRHGLLWASPATAFLIAEFSYSGLSLIWRNFLKDEWELSAMCVVPSYCREANISLVSARTTYLLHRPPSCCFISSVGHLNLFCSLYQGSYYFTLKIQFETLTRKCGVYIFCKKCCRKLSSFCNFDSFTIRLAI